MQATISRVVRLRAIDMAAVKAGAAQFEPALRLHNSLSINKEHETNDTVGDKDDYLMTTFSPFDPGATHTIHQSGIAVSRALLRATVPATTTVQTTALTVKKKPWPYSLPRFLQPHPGTMYAQMHSDAPKPTDAKEATKDKDDDKQEKEDTNEKKTHVSAVQAVLYGVPEPTEYRYMGEIVREGDFIWKVLYGSKESEGEEGQKEGAGKVIDMEEWAQTKEKWMETMETALEVKRKRDKEIGDKEEEEK